MRRTPGGKASAVKKVASCAGDIFIKARKMERTEKRWFGIHMQRRIV